MTKDVGLPPLDPELTSLVAAERASTRGPSGAQRARLQARLIASLAVPAAGAALSATAGASTAAKVAVVAIALGTGAAVGIYRLAPSGEQTVRPMTAPRPQAVAPPAGQAWADERRLVQEGREALAQGAGARAIDRLDEHVRRFPRGLLAEERDALRVRALIALGRLEEAREAAARFDASYPASVHREAVRRALPPAE